MFEVNHFESFASRLFLGAVFKQMLWHSLHIVLILGLLASVAGFPALEVVIAAFTALPATGWELAVLPLLFSFEFVAHALLAPVAAFAALEVIVQALVAVPSSFWEFEWLPVVDTVHKVWVEWLSGRLERIGEQIQVG